MFFFARKIIIAGSLMVMGLSLSSCSDNKGTLPGLDTAIRNSGKFDCLSFPSSAYRVGTVLRTLENQSINKISVDYLTFSEFSDKNYKPIGKFADITEILFSGVGGDFVLDFLKNLDVLGNNGAKIEAVAEKKYSLKAAYRNNDHYVISDKNGKLIQNKVDIEKGKRYFLVKEALGSNSMDFSVISKSKVAFEVGVNAANSKFAVTPVDETGKSSQKSQELLFACVVLEEVYQVPLYSADGKMSIERRIKKASDDIDPELFEVLRKAVPQPATR